MDVIRLMRLLQDGRFREEMAGLCAINAYLSTNDSIPACAGMTNLCSLHFRTRRCSPDWTDRRVARSDAGINRMVNDGLLPL
jgi:hypothetical protein